MILTTNHQNNSILPTCQSIRSPRSQEADDLTQKFLQRRRLKLMTLLFIVMVAAISFVARDTSSSFNMQPAFYDKTLSDEPNVFTPHIVLTALRKTTTSSQQRQEQMILDAVPS